MRSARILSAIACIGLLVSASPATSQQNEEYEQFRSDFDNSGSEWVVISYHFRHGDDCTTYGCVIIGPTGDRPACEEWASLYNGADPFDHVRCVDATSYEIPQYN